jgi:YtkA-like
MKRVIICVVLGGLLLAVGDRKTAWGAELKVIHTQKTPDMVVTLRSESGQWTQGKNTFVLEFTSMAMPGMAPMLAGATLSPDKTPGRYLGTISFPDRGARQVTIAWDGPAGKGSTQFSVPVR